MGRRECLLTYGVLGTIALYRVMADFVRMKAGYASDQWSPPGVGDQWDQGYEVTAHFLDFCDNIKNGFMADLNTMMKTSYSESYFNDLLGKPVAQLWSDYKA
ncbi:basic secretory family protein, partial [Trifolium pratense]